MRGRRALQAYLYAATKVAVSQKAATCLLLLLGCSTGMFAASTALLPSTFTMCALTPVCLPSRPESDSTSVIASPTTSRYAVTAASAGVLRGHHTMVIAVCAVGALLGWPFAALAMLPLCVYTLGACGAVALPVAATAAVATLGPQLWVRFLAHGREGA